MEEGCVVLCFGSSGLSWCDILLIFGPISSYVLFKVKGGNVFVWVVGLGPELFD